MTLVRWNPYRSLVSLPGEIDKFFSDFGLDIENYDRVWNPFVDVSETKDAYEIKAEIPGLKKEDIKVSIKDNVLTLSGEKKQEKESKSKNYHRIERAFGRFQRSFRLPGEVKSDVIKAKYKNGVLSVEIPKTEELKPKEIAVN